MKRQLALFLAAPSSPSSPPAASSQDSLQSGANAETGTIAVLLGHIQDRIVEDAYVTFRRAVEFLPAEDTPSHDPESNRATERTFMTPEAVRALVRDLR